MAYVNNEQAQERLYSTNRNKYGDLITIIDYKSDSNIVVQFENGFKRKTTYATFIKGTLKSPYTRTICGVGYLGEGPYLTMEGRKSLPRYDCWRHMLRRCYDKTTLESRPTYNGCTVHPTWHNYQNFARWYEENYYVVAGNRMELDKDILVKGNTVYSPGTCVFVPSGINKLVTRNQKKRGSLPMGVTQPKITHGYNARIHGTKIIGTYPTIEEAFAAYKAVKEEHIKVVAGEYKPFIPKYLYEALLAYKIEITD